MRHVMIDVETWGLRPGCALRSIGAVEFTLDGRFGKTFYANITRSSCEEFGLLVDRGTEAFWRQQPPEVQKLLMDNQVHIEVALPPLAEWLGGGSQLTVWAHGSDFDFPILRAAFDRLKIKTPWLPTMTRDSRTVVEVFGFDVRDIPFPAENRSAKARAHFQAQCLIAALQRGVPGTKAAAAGGVFG